MHKIALLTLSFFLLMQSGCRRNDLMPSGSSDLIVSSTQIVPEAVFMDLMLEYNARSNKTIATATFIYRNPFDSLDGARVRLNSWNAITFNGTPLQESGNQAVYQRIFNGYLPEGDFVWTSWIFMTYTNRAVLRSADFPDALPIDLPANNYRAAWKGDPVDTNPSGIDEVGLVVRKITPTFWTSTPGDTATLVNKDKMDKLKDKNNWGKCLWYRNTDQPLQQGTLLGGRIRTSYESVQREVQSVLTF